MILMSLQIWQINESSRTSRSELKKQLIELRDGPIGQRSALPENKLSGFELIVEVKGESIIHLGEIEVAKILTKQRASVRIRAAGTSLPGLDE